MIHTSLTLRQLTQLVALYDTGSFSKAAEYCMLSQSSLSHAISTLEQQLGAVLVDRTSRRVVFTLLGQDIVKRARNVLQSVEEIHMTAHAASEPLGGSIRLGVIPTIAPFFLPRVLPTLRTQYPRLRLYLQEDQSHRVLESLHGGRLDAVLLALPFECGPVDSASLFEDGFVLALPANHSLTQKPVASSEDIMREPLLLLSDGHCLRDHALSSCRIGPRPHQVDFEATSLHTLVQMVDNGIGLTLLPEMAITAGILNGTGLVTRPVDEHHPSRTIALVWRKNSARSPEFLMLAETLSKNHHPRTIAA